MKNIEIVCTQETKDLMCRCILEFVEHNYPKGTADCGLAARESLLDCVNNINQQFNPDKNQTIINKRVKPFIKLAIQHHFNQLNSNTEPSQQNEMNILLDALNGEQR
ncbi:MAG: hypothetical protein HON94_08050 [Methylococcales bacterium]|jgi:hypothetical protein|nr:hypothetical protein [Methylococcales bacterium]MBT7411422.1 hypothetical protein [Methylococcales bacterium]